MIKAGAAEIHRVEENTIQVPLALMGTPPDLIADNLDWLAPDLYSPHSGEFTMVFQSWLLRLNGLTALVDPCNGN